MNENERNLLRNELIEPERKFAINLLKMQERTEQTHERTKRMPTMLKIHSNKLKNYSGLFAFFSNIFSKKSF